MQTSTSRLPSSWHSSPWHRAWPRPRRISAIGSRRTRGRAPAYLSRGRPRPRDHRDRRSRRQSLRAGVAVRETEGVDAPAPDQPVRHRAPHVPRARRRQAERRRREARRRARHATAPQGVVERSRPCQAEVGRGLAPKTVSKGACQEIVLEGDDVDLGRLPIQRCWPGRSRAVHHAPRRDHEGPEDRCPQRRYVPRAGRRQELDLRALADAQRRGDGPARPPRTGGSRLRSRSGSTRCPRTRRAPRSRTTWTS